MGSVAPSLTPFAPELAARFPACIPWTGCSLPVSEDQPVVPQPRGMLPCLLLSCALKKVDKIFRKNLPGRRANLRSHLVRSKTRHLMVPCRHFRRVHLFAIVGVARQAPLSMGFSRQESWSCCHALLQGLPHPGMEPASLKSPALAGGFFTI